MTLSYHYLLEQLELWVGWRFVALLVESTYETIYLPLCAQTAKAMGRVDMSCVALLFSWSYIYMTLSYHYLLELVELLCSVDITCVALLVKSTYETIYLLLFAGTCRAIM